LAAYDAALQTNPNDTTALLGIANILNDLYQQGEGDGNQYLLASADYLEKVIAADPTQKDIYMRLAKIYMSDDVNDSAKAVAVLNKAVSVDPDNPDVYLQLGIAQQKQNNVTAAVLAWQKYLELVPTGEMSDTIRDHIATLTETTTTTTAETTTTTAGSTTTTTAGTTTTGQ
jgi:tetratricopeptide (TPR) repeat protein